MLTPYITDDSSDTYQNYFASQAGYGMNVFRGSAVQTGHGIGSFFKGLARSSLPLLKTAAKKAMRLGASVASDAISGKNVGDSFREHGKRAGAELLGSLASGLSDAGDYPKSKRKRKVHKRDMQIGEGTILRNVHVRA